MVAYSFKKQFAPRIEEGSKAQTIRADRKRHARPGETLQLYTGMRTSSCRLIGTATCLAVSPIRLDLARETITIGAQRPIHSVAGLDKFARADGFDGFIQMREFWRQTHAATEAWDGVLIEWARFQSPCPP